MLRAASLVLVVWMIRAALGTTSGDHRAVTVSGGALARSLESSALEGASAVHLLLDTVPDRLRREWLRALQRSGTRISWSSPAGIPSTAIEVQRVSDPAGGARVLVAAPAGATVMLSDAGGMLDTARAATVGASFSLPGLEGEARALVGRQVARAFLPDSLLRRRLLVLGRAGWENKFAVAVLEERGWTVDARARVAPAVDVVQGAPAPPDTARYAAVIILDSTGAAMAPDLMRYARDGGGIVLAGDAPRSASLAPLIASPLGDRVRAVTLVFASNAPRRALDFYPLTALRADAVRLDARDGRVAAAARRVGAGRVVQVGYDETWRWRFADSESAPAEHRAWWAAVVDAAAYRATRSVVSAPSADAAPRATLVDAFGASSLVPARSGAPRPARALRGWMLPTLLALLLAEWTSRRFRGAP